MAAKTKTYNRLWQARGRANLEQKQVARLLGHTTCDQLSRYERGARMPGLRIAFKLEIIYRTPVSRLFPEQYQRCRAEIAADAERFNKSLPYETDEEPLPEAHVCTYGSLLLKKKTSQAEINAVRKHCLRLIEKSSEVIHRQKPFA